MGWGWGCSVGFLCCFSSSLVSRQSPLRRGIKGRPSTTSSSQLSFSNNVPRLQATAAFGNLLSTLALARRVPRTCLSLPGSVCAQDTHAEQRHAEQRHAKQRKEKHALHPSLFLAPRDQSFFAVPPCPFSVVLNLTPTVRK